MPLVGKGQGPSTVVEADPPRVGDCLLDIEAVRRWPFRAGCLETVAMSVWSICGHEWGGAPSAECLRPEGKAGCLRFFWTK